MGPAGGYGPPGVGNPAGYYTSAPPGSSFGPVYYAVNQPASNVDAAYETRRGAALAAINDFMNDAKRRMMDPLAYPEMTNRLAALQPYVQAVQPTPAAEYHHGPVMAAAPHAPAPIHHYALPLPSVKTKSEVSAIDQFLEQLSSSIYENSNQAAAAGVAQPGDHYLHPNVNYRYSHSPPQLHQQAHSHGLPPHANAVVSAPPSASSSIETPALTPASTVLSYASGHSPSSVHSGQALSPVSRPGMASMYPALPAVTGISEAGNSYGATSGAPASALATSFKSDHPRRYSGGILQQAARPMQRADDMDTTDDSSSATGSPHREPSDRDTLPRQVTRLAISPSKVDPSLCSPTTQSLDAAVEGPADRPTGSWLEAIRVVEFLRNVIRANWERGDIRDDDEQRDADGPAHGGAESLYPDLSGMDGHE